MLPLTRIMLLKQGSCCGNGCMNCPYAPRHTKGIKRVKKSDKTTGIKSLSGVSEVIDMWNDATHSELLQSITKTCEAVWATGAPVVNIDFDTDIKPYSDFERILNNVLKYLDRSREWKSDIKRIGDNSWHVKIYYNGSKFPQDCIIVEEEEDG